MMKHLLPPVTYYKANLHTHSTVSDGKLTPEEVRDAYKEKGYSILAITDHSVMVEHQHLNQPDFLLLTGVEIDVNDTEGNVSENKGRERHFCLIGKDPKRQWIPFRDPRPIPCSVQYEAVNEIAGMPRDYSPEGMNAMIAECNRQGFLVTYNHPGWSLESYPDYAPMKGLWAMEYRNSCGLTDQCNEKVYRDLLMLGNRLVPICADDTHRPVTPSGLRVLGANWTMIGAESLTYSNVIKALEKGDLYSSCGPEIHSLTWEDGIIRVTCSPCRSIRVITHGRHAQMREAYDGAVLSEAEFDMKKWMAANEAKDIAFLHLIVTDLNGGYAVTRAYWMDELKG